MKFCIIVKPKLASLYIRLSTFFLPQCTCIIICCPCTNCSQTALVGVASDALSQTCMTRRHTCSLFFEFFQSLRYGVNQQPPTLQVRDDAHNVAVAASPQARRTMKEPTRTHDASCTGGNDKHVVQVQTSFFFHPESEPPYHRDPIRMVQQVILSWPNQAVSHPTCGACKSDHILVTVNWLNCPFATPTHHIFPNSKDTSSPSQQTKLAAHRTCDGNWRAVECAACLLKAEIWTASVSLELGSQMPECISENFLQTLKIQWLSALKSSPVSTKGNMSLLVIGDGIL